MRNFLHYSVTKTVFLAALLGFGSPLWSAAQGLAPGDKLPMATQQMPGRPGRTEQPGRYKRGAGHRRGVLEQPVPVD